VNDTASNGLTVGQDRWLRFESEILQTNILSNRFFIAHYRRFTFWAAGPSWSVSHLINLLPWILWTSSPYIALAAMMHIARQSHRASNIVLFSSILIGIINLTLLVYTGVLEKTSGELWLVVPLYELLICIPILIAVLFARSFARTNS
jgi:hypothetical protein